MSDSDFRHLLVILPAYNESNIIGSVIHSLHKQGFKNILIVDDGSTDNTSEISRIAGAQVVRHYTNRGAGAASQTGIVYARKHNWQYAVLMDADGQHYAEDIDTMIKQMHSTGSDIVIGNRFAKKSSSIPSSRIALNKLANILTNLFCKTKVSDSQSGFRLLNRNSIEKLNLRVDGFGFCSEMIIVAEHLDLGVAETPISVDYTEYSMSKGQNFLEGINTAFNFIWRIMIN